MAIDLAFRSGRQSFHYPADLWLNDSDKHLTIDLHTFNKYLLENRAINLCYVDFAFENDGKAWRKL